VQILTKDEIPVMREACRLAGQTLKYIGEFVKVGITTNELNRLVHEYTLAHKAVPAPLGYHGFPKSVCTSINHVICHGVPDETILKDGDIVNVDVTSVLNGFFGDTSATFFVGEVSETAKDITEVAEKAMWKGIDEVKPFATTGDIGFAINKFVSKRGYHVVREIGGHGVGRQFHDDPFVPSHGKKGRGDKLKPGMCITVEPMVNETGVPLVEKVIPGSSIRWYETGDQTLSAQFEHTVLVTETGHEVLTLIK
jgi:methionyl aminopeptidase